MRSLRGLSTASYECNDSSGCSFSAGTIDGTIDDGQQLEIRWSGGTIILIRIHIGG